MINKDNHHNNLKCVINDFSKIIIITIGSIEEFKIILIKFIDLQIYSDFGKNT